MFNSHFLQNLKLWYFRMGWEDDTLVADTAKRTFGITDDTYCLATYKK